MDSKKKIQDLPDGVLVKIFSYLSLEDLINSVQGVCDRWMHILQCEELWKKVVYTIDDDMTDEGVIKMLKCCHFLRKINFLRYVSNIVFVELYKNCRLLTTIHFHENQEINRTIFKNLVTLCSKISNIKVPNSWLQNYGIIEDIGEMKNLEKFSIEMDYCYAVSYDMKLKPLADGCPNLLALDLSYTNVDSRELDYFLEKKHKQLLSFTAPFTIYHGPVTPHLTVCAHTLKELYLHSSSSSNDIPSIAYQAIGKLHNLSCLCIEEIRSIDPKVIAGIFDRNSFPQLKTLFLYWQDYSFTDCILRTVSTNCPLLEELSLHQLTNFPRPALSDYGFELLSCLCHLKSLSFDFRVAPSYIPTHFLGNCESIQSFSICIYHGHYDISSELNGFIHLKSLTLIQCDVTDFPWLELPTIMPVLRNLKFIACNGIDTHRLGPLRQSMPYLTVSSNYSY